MWRQRSSYEDRTNLFFVQMKTPRLEIKGERWSGGQHKRESLRKTQFGSFELGLEIAGGGISISFHSVCSCL